MGLEYVRDKFAIHELKLYGYQGFLIGENFMKTANAGLSAKEFISKL